MCVDCIISSIVTVAVNLNGADLAADVSGKGLATYPGLSMVFYTRRTVSPNPHYLPCYLDLGFYAAKDGVPFTGSSNLLAALDAALERPEPPQRRARVRELSNWLRRRLERRGFRVLLSEEITAPAVLTLPLPASLNSLWLADALRDRGYFVSYESAYLVARNWVQICLLGECSKASLKAFLSVLFELAGT